MEGTDGATLTVEGAARRVAPVPPQVTVQRAVVQPLADVTHSVALQTGQVTMGGGAGAPGYRLTLHTSRRCSAGTRAKVAE